MGSNHDPTGSLVEHREGPRAAQHGERGPHRVDEVVGRRHPVFDQVGDHFAVDVGDDAVSRVP